MGGFSHLTGWHLAIIAVVVLVLFGSKKMPDAARSFGRSLRIFKAETKGLMDDKDDVDATTPPTAANPAEHLPQALPQGQDVARAREATPTAAEARHDEH